LERARNAERHQRANAHALEVDDLELRREGARERDPAGVRRERGRRVYLERNPPARARAKRPSVELDEVRAR
jgi:hypothetical protein